MSDRPAFSLSVFRSALTRLRLPIEWLWRRVDPDDSEPARPGQHDDLDRDKVRVQVGVIRKAFGDGVAVAASDGAGRAEDDADMAYLFRPGHALVRRDRLDDVLAFFKDNPHTYVDPDEERAHRDEERDPEDERLTEPVPGMVRLRMPGRRDGRDDVLATLDELDRSLGEQDPMHPVATPDHLLYVTPVAGGVCPADEPEVPRMKGPWPPLNSNASAGDGVRVSVVDTGLWMGSVDDPDTPWISDVVPAHSSDKEQLNLAAIRPYGGHGTFVSGIIKCLAPSTRVEVEGMLTKGGAIYESEICEKLHEALTDSDDPQLISISAGTHTRKDMALLGFDMLKEAHSDGLGGTTLVVAAAGNDSSSAPFWPAAFEWVIGVGSVDADGKLSDYSNYGPWVDVYARGRDLVNAFPTGTYTCYEPKNIHNGVPDVRQFTNLAQWSGTSFSTPVVTGLIAASKEAAKSIEKARDEVLGSASMINGLPVVGPLT